MARKRNLSATLCWAQWAAKNINEIKDNFVSTCKSIGIRFELIDVDTEEGAQYSVRRKFRNVPMMIIFENDKEIARYNGNQCFIHLLNL